EKWFDGGTHLPGRENVVIFKIPEVGTSNPGFYSSRFGNHGEKTGLNRLAHVLDGVQRGHLYLHGMGDIISSLVPGEGTHFYFLGAEEFFYFFICLSGFQHALVAAAALYKQVEIIFVFRSEEHTSE